MPCWPWWWCSCWSRCSILLARIVKSFFGLSAKLHFPCIGSMQTATTDLFDIDNKHSVSTECLLRASSVYAWFAYKNRIDEIELAKCKAIPSIARCDRLWVPVGLLWSLLGLPTRFTRSLQATSDHFWPSQNTADPSSRVWSGPASFPGYGYRRRYVCFIQVQIITS